MIGLDKIKAFFKWDGKGMGFSGPKPEARGAERKAAEPLEKKGDGSSSK